MAASTPGEDVYAETLAVFERDEVAYEPLTTPEVADALDLERRTVYKRLERLAERGALETKKAGARARVWWRPPAIEDEPRELQRYETVVETVDDGIYVVDEEGQFTMVNDRYVEMVDATRETLLGSHVSSVVDESVAERAQDLERRLREGDADTATLEATLPGEDEPIVAEATFSILPTEEGHERVAVVRDVTDRVGRESELEATKAELETEREFVDTALDRLEDVFYVFDTDGELVRWNEQLPAMSGYSDDELAGMSALDLVAEEDHQSIARAIKGVYEGDPPPTPETTLVGKDGERVPVAVNGSVLTDDTGDVLGIVGTARDISARKRRERELERYEALFEESTDVNAVMGPDGTFRYLTPSVERVLGYDREELVGEDAFEYVHPDDRDAVAEPFEALLAGSPRGDPVEFRFQRADGSWAVLEAGARNLLEDPGIGGLVVYTREVTRRTERERELERRVRQQEAVADLGRLALETDDLDELFDAAVERVASALGHDYCKVLEHRPASEDLLLRNGVGWDEGYVGEAAVGTDRDSQAGFTLAAEEPVVVTDLATETRFSGPDLLVDHDVTSGISMVIGPAADPWGVLGTHHTERREYAAQDVAFVHAVANVLATAIERRRHDRELERYEAVLETVWDGIVVLDPDDRFLLVNDALCEMTGHDRDDLVGAHATSIMDETTYDTAEDLHDEVLTGDRDVATLEYDLQSDDGDVVPVEARFGPYELDDGTAGGAGVIRDVTERLERERQLKRQRERLRALNNVNAVVREINQAVVDESTRAEIERAVCERLASSESYRFAWICGVDPVTGTVEPRVEAGVDGYLEEIPLSIDADDPAGRGPFGRAVRTYEAAVTADAFDDPEFEPWREYAETYGYRSSMAVPIVHEEALYGVLGVYSERPGAFDGEERTVIEQLGPLVGHSIAAADRKRALTSDDLVELKFQIRDVFDDGDLEATTDGRVTIDRTVDLGDGSHLAYGTATGDALATVRSGVQSDEVPHWSALTVIDEDGDATRFQLRLDGPPIFSIVASYGGYVAGAELADGDIRMTIHVSTSVDVRRFVDAVQEQYPELEPTTRRQVSRDAESVHPVRTVVGEELTDRQRAVLEAAYHAGFFQWPRSSSGEDVAESVGITPSTFHQHLRKAERKVFDRLFDGV